MGLSSVLILTCFLPSQTFANHLQDADLALLTVLVADEGDSNPHLSGRTPLILIHGIHGNKPEGGTDDINNPNRGYWSNFISFFYNSSNLNNDYKLYRFHYVSDQIDVDHISQGLRYWINLGFGTDRPIVILAHSMGGLVARSYMNYYGGGERVLKLITLATPHHGSPGANSQSRDELATDFTWQPYLDLAIAFVFDWEKDPILGIPIVPRKHDDPNRSDLRWDNFDNRMNSANLDINIWLWLMNALEKDENKIIAYYGYIDPEDPIRKDMINSIHESGLHPGNYLMKFASVKNDHSRLLAANIFMNEGMKGYFPYNDGLVPKESAAFNGHSISKRVECPGYDHLDMKDNSAAKCKTDKTLFESLRDDLAINNLPAYPPGFGSVIGYYRSENVYSNGKVSYYSCSDRNFVGNCRTDWGVEWQCVEFVNRFYNRVMGMPNWRGTGHAYKYWDTYREKGLEQYSNGENVPPQVDDILVWDRSVGGGYGHVAIVKEVSEDKVTVVEQNWNNSNPYREIPRTGNYLSSKGLLGWLRKPVGRLSEKSLIQAEGYPEVYWFQNGKRYHVLSESIIGKMTGIAGWSKINVFPKNTLDLYPEGPKFIVPDSRSEGLLIKQQDKAAVFVIKNGQRHHIASDKIFNQLGYDWNDIIEVSQVIIEAIPEGNRIDNPTAILNISVDKREYQINETLRASLFLEISNKNAQLDLYIVLQSPNGNWWFLKEDGQSFTDEVTPFRIDKNLPANYRWPSEGSSGNILNYKFTGKDSPGGYNLYALLVLAGSDPFDEKNRFIDSEAEFNLKGQTPPAAPAGFTDSVSGNTVTLRWNANSESRLAGYKLYYGTYSGQYEGSYDLGNVTYQSLNSIPYGTYYLALTAYNTSGNESGYSNEVKVTVTERSGGHQAPSVPTGFYGSVSGSEVVLSWNQNLEPDIDHYNIYMGLSPGDYRVAGSPFNAGNITSLVVDNVADGTYYLALSAVNTSGQESALSNEIPLTVKHDNQAGNNPPVACFEVNFTAGDKTTTFQVDASCSSDKEDTLSSLEVRWDWENDGEYDTVFSTIKTASHQYSSDGTYTIKLEVRDSGGLNDITTRQVVISSSPVLNVSPSSLSFIAQEKGDNPPDQYLQVSNKGGGILQWSLSSDLTWLGADHTSGSVNSGDSDTIKISALTSGLTKGSYNGAIIITASNTNTGGSSKTIPVSLTITEASSEPLLQVSPNVLVFTGTEGGKNPDSQSFSVINGGGGTLPWSLSDDAAWLSASPISGSLTKGSSSLVSVAVNISSLKAGTYNGSITLTADGAQGSPKKVSVTLTIKENQPPDTTIISGPSGTITTKEVSFTWIGTDDLTPSSELLYSYYLQGYDSNWSSFSSTTATSYTNLSNGSYTFYVKAKDQAGKEDPSPASLTFTVGTNQPPTIASLTANPSTVNPGGQSTISVSASDPENDSLSYTWSTNGGSLSGTTGAENKTWTAPSTTGTYSVTVSVTDNKSGHNPVTRSVYITVTSTTTSFDLTISASVGSSYSSGQNGVQVPVTVYRSGGNITGGTYVLARLYWSTNSSWDSSDTQLWESNGSTPDYPISYLNSYGSKTVTATVNIPSVSSSGTYYIIAVVDPTNYHSESNEGNNVASYAVSVIAPPQISSISPTSASAGTFNVVITGNYFTDVQSVAVYYTSGSFVGNATFTVNSSTQITATVTLAAGTYYFRVTTTSGTSNNSSTLTVN